MKIIKHVAPGDVLPPFYGFAWHTWTTRAVVALPVPLNLIAGVLRGVWIFLRWGWCPIRANPRDAYAQGYREGKCASSDDWLDVALWQIHGLRSDIADMGGVPPPVPRTLAEIYYSRFKDPAPRKA